jgi:hypothetical protein
MTPKEKAKELVDKFRNEITSFLGDNMKKINAKQCALIAVDEIINIIDAEDQFILYNYCQQVKQEINKL